MNVSDSNELSVLGEIGNAWAVQGQGARHAAVLRGAQSLRERLRSAPAVVAVKSFSRTSLVYPSRYAFCGSAMSPARFISMVHRTALVRFRQDGAVKTLLFNPTDIEASRRTPYFARMIEKLGFAERVFARKFEPLEAQLGREGLAPEDIDYIAFDHFHTQDLRPLLGTRDGRHAPRYPRARLLAPRVEWRDWDALHPMQAAWFVADGKDNAIEDRVIFTSDDLWLGDGVALVRTPGHTSGNQTLFFKTERGVWGISENGVAADNWSPQSSRIVGVAGVAKHQRLDVVLNSNTIESGAEQYTSMMLEKTVVDAVPHAPEFCQMYPSSEAEASLLAPGLAPSFVHGEISFGSFGTKGADEETRVATSRGFGALSDHYRP